MSHSTDGHAPRLAGAPGADRPERALSQVAHNVAQSAGSPPSIYPISAEVPHFTSLFGHTRVALARSLDQLAARYCLFTQGDEFLGAGIVLRRHCQTIFERTGGSIVLAASSSTVNTPKMRCNICCLHRPSNCPLERGRPAIPTRCLNGSHSRESGQKHARIPTPDHQPPNRLTSFEPLALPICLSVKSLPRLNPFVMRLLRSAACLSSA